MPSSRWISKAEEWGKLPMGKTTCHRLTGGQRSGHQGDHLQMHFPKVGVGTRGSETRLLSDSQSHTGETEARSSISWPGSHGIRSQTSGSSRPRGGRESPGPHLLSGQQLLVHLPHSSLRRHRGESLEQKTQGAGPGRDGGGTEAIRGGGPRGPAGPAAPGRMAPAAGLRGAVPRALLLPLLMLLLLLPPPPLLARATRPPVSARRRPAAPCLGGAGHAGWAQWQSWTHGGARGWPGAARDLKLSGSL